MSKKLIRAIAEGKVTVRNTSSGEVSVILITSDGSKRTVLVAPFGERELAPRLTSVSLVKKSPNLASLLRGPLRIVG